MELTEFLLARIAEDEAEANVERDDFGTKRTFYSTFGAGQDDWGVSYFNVPPARVLAECEAKRRVIQIIKQEPAVEWAAGEGLLRALAAIYADHPDYRDEWRP